MKFFIKVVIVEMGKAKSFKTYFKKFSDLFDWGPRGKKRQRFPA